MTSIYWFSLKVSSLARRVVSSESERVVNSLFLPTKVSSMLLIVKLEVKRVKILFLFLDS